MNDLRTMADLFAVAYLAAMVTGCGGDDQAAAPPPPPLVTATEERAPCDDRNPLRNAYFGDLHVHTALSFDANVNGTRALPADAYRFARGEAIALPANPGDAPVQIQLKRPLDFAAVTDHAEFLAEVTGCAEADITDDGTFDSARCVRYRQGGQGAITSWGVSLTQAMPRRFVDICGEDGSVCAERARTVWQRVIDAAEGAYDRSAACSMTTFIGFEWTANTQGANLHRNVIFRNGQVPAQPMNYFDQPTAEDLWRALEAECLDADTGCEAMAIPHNSNLSNGGIFAPTYPGAESLDEQRTLATRRARVEPLVEIFQHKGSSECQNGLSGVFGDPDELCEVEQVRPAPFEDCGDEIGGLGITAAGCVSRYDSVRATLIEGLREQTRLNVNPYRLGVIASTDTHNAAPGFTDEADFKGHTGLQEFPEERTLDRQILPFGLVTNPGGLAGVWAVENSRDAIYEALLRRETWGTSGPRIAARLFASWAYPDDLCRDPDAVLTAYRFGVPMGGTLPPRPEGIAAPTFWATALRDPDADATPLQRLEIIKGWLDDQGQLRYRVHVVAGDPNNGATVDPNTCQRQGDGADSLCATWTDPDYDPSEPAFYQLRVVENPSCRWSQHLCLSLPPDQRPEGCTDPGISHTLHEMAWTSPIWLQ